MEEENFTFKKTYILFLKKSFLPGASGSCLYPYSGGRDQDNCDSKPAQANSSQDPILKIPITKNVGGVAQGEGPEFKPQCCKKKQKSFLYLNKALKTVLNAFL
jgi:hypothetical protein